MQMAKWGKKKWEVTTKKLNSIDALSYSMTYDTDSRRKEARTLTLPYTVYKEFGVDPKKEIDNWYKYLGKKYPLYIGKKRFGPKKFKLIGVSVSELKAIESGVIRSATFSLSFEEP